MIIAKAEPSDAEELLKIYAPYVEETAITFEYEVPDLEEFTRRIRNISAKYPYIKAVDEDGEILGYAYAGTFNVRRAYDWSVEMTVYVKKECRHGGVGKALYCELERILKAMGVLNVNACIGVPRTEDKHLTMDSVHFHEHMGYRMVGTFHDVGYKFDTWYDMAWMEKMLGEHGKNQPDVAFGQWQSFLK